MKLNKKIRNAIVENALANSPAKQEADDADARVALLMEEFRRVCLVFSDAQLDKIQTALKKAVEPYLSSAVVGVPDLSTTRNIYQFNFHDEDHTDSEDRMDFDRHVYGKSYMKLPAGNYKASYEKAKARQAKARQALAQLRAEVAGAVAQASTVDKLLEMWPECEAFIPKDAAVQSVALTIPAAELNRRLGIA